MAKSGNYGHKHESDVFTSDRPQRASLITNTGRQKEQREESLTKERTYISTSEGREQRQTDIPKLPGFCYIIDTTAVRP